MKRSEEIKRGPLFRAPGPRTQGSMRIEREKEREVGHFLPMMLGRGLCSSSWQQLLLYHPSVKRVKRAATTYKHNIRSLQRERPSYASIRNYPADCLRQIFMRSRARSIEIDSWLHVGTNRSTSLFDLSFISCIISLLSGERIFFGKLMGGAGLLRENVFQKKW